MKIEKEELGEKMYDAFMFLAIIALIACLCFADKPHTDTITEKRETVTVQDKFSELDTSEMVLIQFADTEYYLTVSRKNDTDLHDVEVSKRQYHSIGKGSKVKCIVTYRNGKVDDIEIDEDDLKIDTYRASGAGGQHVNKTSSAIRITHLPTGIVVQCQNERSQHHNKEKAMQMLKAKLQLMKEQEQAEKVSDIRGEVKDIGFGNQIRSYVMQPYTLVKDHRTNEENSNVNAVMDGDIDSFINAYLKKIANG